MIRRELRTTDGQVHWLLVSQVEHARLSGLLAAQWTSSDFSPYEYQDEPLPDATIKEILVAITHHDDGWARWEASPLIDPAYGRPYSFMNELPLEESLVIWNDSIYAARQIGPLAGWLVAGHFSELLCQGNHQRDLPVVVWLEMLRQQRHEWLGEWQQANAKNILAVAERGLRLLQVCDFFSLWLCCDCPVMADEAVQNVQPFMFQGPSGIYEFTARRQACESSKSPEVAGEVGWVVEGGTWPFADDELHLTADAWLAPVRRYENSQELLAARRVVSIDWRLTRSLRRRWISRRHNRG